MKLKTQILAIALGLAASTSLVWSADRPQRETTPNLVGLWQAVRHGVNCDTGQDLGNSFPALITFHSDGTMTGDTGPFDATNEYGSWQREPGSQNYSVRVVFYSYTAEGDFDGRGEATEAIQLTTADSFTGTGTVQFFDADGNLLFSGCGRATATRFE